MKLKQKIIIASAILGLSLSSAQAQSFITPGTPVLMAGWDFDNIAAGSIASPSRARYSDVFGNNSSPTALTAPGGLYFNGSFGSDNWGTVGKTTTGDVNRDILTRSGTGSTFDLGGQTGGEGATNFNNAGVGTTFGEFAFNLNTTTAFNNFESFSINLWGRDIANTAGGATINWSYSLDGGTTKVSTGLSSSFVGNVFANSSVNFSSFTALDLQPTITIIGDVVESESSVVLSLDNIGIYGVAAAIPEPSTYAAILGAFAIGVAILRRRRSEIAV